MIIKPELTILIDDNSKEKEYYEFFNLKYTTRIILKDALLDYDELDLIIITKNIKNVSPYKYMNISSTRNVLIIGINEGATSLAERENCDILHNINNHTSEHLTTIINSNETNTSTIATPSNHTELISPFNLNKKFYNILGWSSYYKSDNYIDKNEKNVELDINFLEIEILELINSNTLLFQFEILDIKYDLDKLKILNIINNFITKHYNI